MQRLRAPEDTRERLDGGPDDVELGLLRGARASRGLRVEPEPRRPFLLRAELVAHHLGPDPAGGAELRDLLEEVVVRVEEEREPRSELIHVETALLRLRHVRAPVREGERELLDRGGAGLPDVIARDRDRVPLGGRPGRELDRVGDEAQGVARRVEELLLGDVLLQDVVLGRATQAGERDPVRRAGEQVHPPEDVRGGVDRHAGRHLGEGDPGEQPAHVVERAHVDPALPDLAERLGVVGVDPIEGGVVERDRQPGLPVLQEVAEPAVRVLGRSEAGEHPHRPEPAPIHRRMDPAGERGLARVADAVERPGGRARRVDPVDRYPAQGREPFLPLRALRKSGGERLLFPTAGALADRVVAVLVPRRRGGWSNRAARRHRSRGDRREL